MSDDFIKRDEHQDAIERVHSRVDTIEKTTTQIEISAKTIEKCVCDMSRIMYGDERADGIITKVSNLGQKVGSLYWFGGIVIGALILTLVTSLMGLILKNGR